MNRQISQGEMEKCERRVRGERRCGSDKARNVGSEERGSDSEREEKGYAGIGVTIKKAIAGGDSGTALAVVFVLISSDVLNDGCYSDGELKMYIF